MKNAFLFSMKLMLLFGLMGFVVFKMNPKSKSEKWVKTGNPIHLANPSFEDVPRTGTTPESWFDCGAEGETPPDIQPGQFNVNKPASHGKSYLGLVVRENGTQEGVSQQLEMPLQAGESYVFSMALCRSKIFLSPVKTAQMANVDFTNPVRLQIWGGSNYCDKTGLLAETGPVDNTDWEKFNFTFEPKKTIACIFLKAHYVRGYKPYYGHILVDDLSPIQPIKRDSI